MRWAQRGGGGCAPSGWWNGNSGRIARVLTARTMCRVGKWGWTERGLMWRGLGEWGQPLRTALHTIIISLQDRFCELDTLSLVIWMALRALMPAERVFEDEKSDGSDENSIKRKISLKKTDRTNLIATQTSFETN